MGKVSQGTMELICLTVKEHTVQGSEDQKRKRNVARRRKSRTTRRKRNVPTNSKLYARVKAAARRKFAVYPSAYANAWLVREYKKRGGRYRRA